MAISQADKIYSLQSAGYDPAEYDMDESGFVTPIKRVAAQPTMSNGMPQPVVRAAPESAGKLQTFAQEAAHAAPSGVAAGFGAKLGSAALAGFRPYGVPVGPLLGGIGGALLGGMGTSAVQEKVEGAIAEENPVIAAIKQQMEEARQANPYSGMAGRIFGAGAAGGMNPSVLNPLKAAGTVAKGVSLVAKNGPGAVRALPPNEVANLANVGVGSALGVGIPVGTQLAQGVPFGEAITSPETLEGFIGGSIMSQPNRLGQKLYGFQPNVDPARVGGQQDAMAYIAAELARQGGEAGATPDIARLFAQAEAAKARAAEALAYQRSKKTTPGALDLLNRVTSTDTVANEGKKGVYVPKMQGENRTLLGANEAATQMFPDLTPEAALAKMKEINSGELTTEKRTAIESSKKTPRTDLRSPEELATERDLIRARHNDELIRNLQRVKAEAEAAKAQAEAAKANQELQQSLQSKLGQGQVAARPEQRVAPRVVPEQGFELNKEIMPDYTGAMETENAATAADTAGAEADAIQDRFNQPAEETMTAEEVAARRLLPDRSLPIGTLQDIATHAAIRRGTDMRATPGLNDQGVPVRGTTWIPRVREALKRIAVEIDPNTATRDTPFHEATGHAYFQFLRESPYATDRALVSRLETLARKAGIENVEEHMASQQGFEAILRDPALNGEGAYKKWFRDWKAHMKTIFNKGSEADIRRVIDSKWQTDPAFDQYFGKSFAEGAEASGTRLNQPIDEQQLAETKNLGYTYDGPQDMGAGVWHAFTRRGDKPTDPGFGATFYVKAGDEANAVKAALAKNKQFGVPEQKGGEFNEKEGQKRLQINPNERVDSTELTRFNQPPQDDIKRLNQNAAKLEAEHAKLGMRTMRQIKPIQEELTQLFWDAGVDYSHAPGIVRDWTMRLYRPDFQDDLRITLGEDSANKFLAKHAEYISDSKKMSQISAVLYPDSDIRLNQPDKSDRGSYWKDRRKQQAEELAAIRAGEAARVSGVKPTTYPQDEAQVASILAAPRRRIALSDIVTLDADSKPVIDKEIDRTIGSAIRAVRRENLTTEGKENPIRYISPADAENIRSNVYADLLENGVDRDGFQRTIYRRTRDAVTAAIADYKQNRQHSVSLNAMNRTTKRELGETIATTKETPADLAMANEDAAAPKTTEPVDTTPETSPVEVRDTEVVQPKAVRADNTAKDVKKVELTAAELHERLSVQRDRLIEEYGEDHPGVEKFDQTIDYLQTLEPKTIVDPRELANKRFNQDAEEDIRRVKGANNRRGLDIMGASMYDKKHSETVVKEMMQNAGDAIRGRANPSVELRLDDDNHSITIVDNGIGMSPEHVVTKMLPAYESGKSATEGAGGYGLAKIALFGSSEKFHVETTADVDGRKLKTTVDGTRDAWYDFVDSGADLPAKLEPGEYDIKGLKMRVEEVTPDATTGTAMTIFSKAGKYDRWQARNQFAGIAQYDVGPTAYTLNGSLVQKPSKITAPIQRTIENPQATVEIRFNPLDKPGNQNYISILNNGLKQFDMYFGQDIKIPDVSINVNPKVGVMDGEYPFTNNRDALKGPIKKQIEATIENIAETYKEKLHNKFRERMDSTSKIQGSSQRFLDISGKLSTEAIKAITTDPRIARLARILNRSTQRAVGVLNQRIGPYWNDVKFMGFANGGGFRGARFGTTEKGSQGEIYYDLRQIIERARLDVAGGKYAPEEAGLALGEHIGGIKLHELAHQISFEEGETHAEAMTDLGGPLAVELGRMAKQVAGEFNEQQLKEFHDWYTKQTGYEEEYNAEANDFVSEAKRGAGTGLKKSRNIEQTRTSDDGEGDTSGETVRGERLNQPAEVYDKFGKAGELAHSWIAPEVDKLHKINPIAGKGAEDFYTRMRGLRGKFEQTLIRDVKEVRDARSIKEWIDQNNKDYEAVVKWLDAKQSNEPVAGPLTAEQERIYQAVKRNLHMTHAEREARPSLATGRGPAEFYLPHVIDRAATSELVENPTSAKSRQYKQDFLDYRTSNRRGAKVQTPAEALADWLTIHGNFKLSEDLNMAANFGPFDKAMGKGLPISMRENNLLDRMSRFNRRAARRLAYEDAIGSKPAVKKAFYEKEAGVSGTKVGRFVVEDMAGVREYDESTRAAVAGVVRAAMLGPLTGAKDVVSGQVLGMQHMQLDQVLPAKWESLKNWRESYKKAVETGVIRDNVGSFESGDVGLKQVQAALGRARDIINKVQGRTLLENVSRTLNFGEGTHLTLDALNSIRTGRLTGTKRAFLDNFMPDWQQYRNATPPIEAVHEAAARYVESVQGTYDFRGLPAVTQKGSLALPLSLARWNVEKFGNFTKHVVDPALKGNYKPLLMSTLGMLIGGTAVNKLVEEVTNKKSRVPTWEEIGASKEQEELVAYKLAAMASMAGYAGILSDVAMSLGNVHFGNKAQTYNNPMLIGLSNVATEAGHVMEALSHGEVPKAVDILNMVMTDFVQAWRLGAAHLSPDKQRQLERTNKSRDLKMFEMGEGTPAGRSAAVTINPLMKKDQREFKQTGDMNRAMELLMPLVERAIADGGNDPDKIRKNLSELKRNSYQTMPSPTENPYTFSRYNEFLTQTQGPEAARQRVEDYMMQNTKNRIKSSMVPSF